MRPLLILLLASTLAFAQQPIDWNRARDLHQRDLRGEKLSADDQEYLKRARAEFPKRGGGGSSPSAQVPPARSETGLVPLTDLTAPYQGEDGGLYGSGRNEPPPALAQAAKALAAQIQPRDADGKPAPGGKIVLLSLGMSNATQEFSAFVRLAKPGTHNPQVVIVDGAQGGQTASVIANPEAAFWTRVDERLQAAGVTPAQVQAVWLKEANAGPREGFPGAARKLSADLGADLRNARARYPNLRLAYLSSRIYAGYATTPLNPEPYAYESAFAVRWLIQEQMKGGPELNFDSAKGEVKAPLILWGPYLWADGTRGRKAGDLTWQREDLGPDGTHPNDSGRQKVAALLLKFFQTDPSARGWFAKP